eukprot:gb/GEZN01010077.1/.p1 GENE.gb/GEZN01010077.1/~~gb/GEZN01010077.1/.p1  ORF type:complete len:325 (-),score=26.67 gb/GEZN01010077.1/:179-1153(-)
MSRGRVWLAVSRGTTFGRSLHSQSKVAVPVLEALRTSRAFINYNPAAPFDFQLGKIPVTDKQLTKELIALHSHGFRGLVTNAMMYGLEDAPRVAKSVGFSHVIAKLWWANDESLEIEKRNLAAQAQHIDAIVVGNEYVHKAIHRGVSAIEAVERLKAEIKEVQRAYGKPVTTGLHRDEWAHYPELATEVGDFVFINLQPWWVQLRNEPELAAKWVAATLRVVKDTPGMPPNRLVLAQEAAFPSATLVPDSAPGATPEAQALFYRTLIQTGAKFVYGFSNDAYFARKNSPPGGYGGLWDENGVAKPAVAELDLGTYPAWPFLSWA